MRPFLIALLVLLIALDLSVSGQYNGRGLLKSPQDACSYGELTYPYTAAINWAQWNRGTRCGTCLMVNGTKGTAIVMVTDLCEDCGYGSLELSRGAFDVVSLDSYSVNIDWTEAPCPFSSQPLKYLIKTSGPYTAIQIRNFNSPIAKVEVQINDSWGTLALETFNYYMVPKSISETLPIRLRLTSASGMVINDTITSIDRWKLSFGKTNFPAPTTLPPVRPVVNVHNITNGEASLSPNNCLSGIRATPASISGGKVYTFSGVTTGAFSYMYMTLKFNGTGTASVAQDLRKIENKPRELKGEYTFEILNPLNPRMSMNRNNAQEPPSNFAEAASISFSVYVQTTNKFSYHFSCVSKK